MRGEQRKRPRKGHRPGSAAGSRRSAPVSGLKVDRDRLLYGRKAVLEVALKGQGMLERVFCLRGAKLDDELKGALASLTAAGVTVTQMEHEELEALRIEGNHQGVLALLVQRAPIELEEIIEKSLSGGNGLIVVLDQLHDPHNVGAILRVAEAAGADGVVSSEARSTPMTAAVRKVSAGASELLPFATVTNLSRALTELKKAGFWIIGTAIGEGSQPLFTTEIPLPAAIVLGSEGEGMRKLTKDLCDVLVTIPIVGKVESLNVNQAASVMLYELLRRRSFAR